MVNAENIALIRDEALRESLSEYYFDKALINTTQERAKTLNRTFTDFFGPFILNKETLSQFYEGDFALPGPGDIDFRSDPELISIMFNLRMATDGQRMDFELKRDQNIALREKIVYVLSFNSDIKNILHSLNPKNLHLRIMQVSALQDLKKGSPVFGF